MTVIEPEVRVECVAGIFLDCHGVLDKDILASQRLIDSCLRGVEVFCASYAPSANRSRQVVDLC